MKGDGGALEFLSAFGIFVVWYAGRAFFERRSARKLRRALAESYAAPEDHSCWRCECIDLKIREPGVFECTQCGNLQGARVDEYTARLREDRLRSLGPTERAAKAHRLLREAELQLRDLWHEYDHLVAAAGLMSSDTRAVVVEDSFSNFRACVNRIQEAGASLNDVAVLIGSPLRIPRFSCVVDLDDWRDGWHVRHRPRALEEWEEQLRKVAAMYQDLQAMRS